MITVPHNHPVCRLCRDRYGLKTFRTVGVHTCCICATCGILCHFADGDQQIDWTIFEMGGVEFTHAVPAAICCDCGKPYIDHPLDQSPEARTADGRPFLHRLCNGTLVELNGNRG